MFSDKLNKSIAEAAKQCMEAKYEPAEPDAEAIAKKKAREEAQRRREEKAERDADDLSKDYKPKTVAKTTQKVAGRAYGGAKQKDIEEDVMMEVSDTTLKSYRDKASTDVAKQWSAGNDKKVQQRARGIGKSSQKLALGHYPKGIKEDAEQIDETPVTKAKAPYRPGSIDPATGKTREAPKGTYAYDKAQRKKLKESFSGLIESYIDGGIKSLFENLQTVEEEVSEEEFNAELKKQKDKAEGKAPQADVAAAATQGTKDMKEEVVTEGLSKQFEIMYREQNGDRKRIIVSGTSKAAVARQFKKQYKLEIEQVKELQKGVAEEVEELDERELTAAETAEKERIVKGMKKGIEGFKQRYGERAKEVMYATATARAKED